MEEGWTYQDAFNDKNMRIMISKWYVSKCLKCEKTSTKERCNMFPCKEKTFYRLIEPSLIEMSFNNGGGSGGGQMRLCYKCFQIHKRNVENSKGKEIVYRWMEK